MHPEWRIGWHSCTSLSWISISPVLDSVKAMSLKYYHMWENVIFSPDGTDHNVGVQKKERHDTWHQYLCSLPLSKRKITLLLFWSERKSEGGGLHCVISFTSHRQSSLRETSLYISWKEEHRKSENTNGCLEIFLYNRIFCCFCWFYNVSVLFCN